MKKIIFSIFVLLITTSVFSQKARFGIIGSPEINWMKPDKKTVVNNGVHFGLSYGLAFDIPMGIENVMLTSGVLIDNAGGKLVYQDTVPFMTLDSTYLLDKTDEVAYKLQYLTIPIGLKLKTNEIGYMTYFAQIGLTTQLNIGAKAKVGNLIDNEKINKEVGLINLNYHIGAGFEYSLSGKTSLLVGVYYNNGFIDVTSIPKELKDLRSADKIVLNNVSLKVGIMF